MRGISRTALLTLAWRHRARVARWSRFAVRAIGRVLSGDRTTLIEEFRLVARVDDDERFGDIRLRVAGRKVRFSGLVDSDHDAAALGAMADQLGLESSVERLRVRRRSAGRRPISTS